MKSLRLIIALLFIGAIFTTGCTDSFSDEFEDINYTEEGGNDGSDGDEVEPDWGG